MLGKVSDEPPAGFAPPPSPPAFVLEFGRGILTTLESSE